MSYNACPGCGSRKASVSNLCDNCAHPKKPDDHLTNQMRFWVKVQCGFNDECWPWLGATTRGGYGSFGINGRTHRANRLAFMFTNGPIPAGLFVCHHCDNPLCCNPSHLFLGTVKDNAVDMRRKGRSLAGTRNPAHLHPERLRRGEANPSAKINSDIVRTIRVRRATGESMGGVSRALGLSRTLVEDVINGHTWRHVT